jgi:hypothetical protein
MRIAQFAILASLAAAAAAATYALPSCSSSDTIVALNVSSSDNVGAVSALHVTISQEGTTPFTDRFAPPSVAVGDAGEMAINPMFFQRETLPDGFTNTPATVAVDALDENQKVFLSASVSVTIVPGGVTAAFVSFAREVPDAGTDGGGDGGSEDGGDGGADGGK